MCQSVPKHLEVRHAPARRHLPYQQAYSLQLCNHQLFQAPHKWLFPTTLQLLFAGLIAERHQAQAQARQTHAVRPLTCQTVTRNHRQNGHHKPLNKRQHPPRQVRPNTNHAQHRTGWYSAALCHLGQKTPQPASPFSHHHNDMVAQHEQRPDHHPHYRPPRP